MRIGIITFHAAHNYGAVIQAYALQKYLLNNDYECKVIDFRAESQRDFNALYPHRNGMKSIVKNVLMLPYDKKRRLREKRFEFFLNNEISLTDTFVNEDQLSEIADEFDIFIAGSDQIWNTTKKADVSKAYFLNFVEYEKTKIAYAVSLGNAQAADLKDFVKFIRSFDAISCREKSASAIIRSFVDSQVTTVLDPTLLLDNSFFDEIVKKTDIPYSNYIFYYSLDGFDKRNRNIEELKILSKRLKKSVVILTPEWPKRVRKFINVVDAGPVEFLALIRDADIVCTNSFHGTALSISFQKDFYVLEKYDGIDDRKAGILQLLDLENRMISGAEVVKKMSIERINYANVNNRLETLRFESKDFLHTAINKGVKK